MIDAVTFRQICAKFATGVAIATVTDAEGTPHGMTVNSFTSVSIVPPLVLICVDYASPLINIFHRRRRYGISILRQDQKDICNRFAQRTQDRFDGVPWLKGETGVPLIPGALAHFECEIRQMVPAGDHEVLIGEVVAAGSHEGSPLVFFERSYPRLE